MKSIWKLASSSFSNSAVIILSFEIIEEASASLARILMISSSSTAVRAATSAA